MACRLISAIIWTSDGILLIRPLGTNFSKINQNSYIFIQENAFENVVCKMPALCIGLNVLKGQVWIEALLPFGIQWLACKNIWSTRMWNMISSPATPTVCLEQKSDNFQSHNVKPNLGCCSNIAITISYISVCCIILISPRLSDLWPFKCQGHSVSLWCWPLTCNLEKCYSLRSSFGMYNLERQLSAFIDETLPLQLARRANLS